MAARSTKVLAQIAVSEDAEQLAEALCFATRALAFYAAEQNWKDDDWNCKAVICHPDYGRGGQKARNALERISKALPAPEQKSEAQR